MMSVGILVSVRRLGRISGVIRLSCTRFRVCTQLVGFLATLVRTRSNLMRMTTAVRSMIVIRAVRCSFVISGCL